jgi:hypothetical protein
MASGVDISAGRCGCPAMLRMQMLSAVLLTAVAGHEQSVTWHVCVSYGAYDVVCHAAHWSPVVLVCSHCPWASGWQAVQCVWCETGA